MHAISSTVENPGKHELVMCELLSALPEMSNEDADYKRVVAESSLIFNDDKLLRIIIDNAFYKPAG